MITKLFYSYIIISGAFSVFQGLFPCGGYALTRDLYNVLFLISGVLLVVFSKSELNTLLKKIVFLPALVFINLLLEFSASAFYPDSPVSFSDFWIRLANAISHGTC